MHFNFKLHHNNFNFEKKNKQKGKTMTICIKTNLLENEYFWKRIDKYEVVVQVVLSIYFLIFIVAALNISFYAFIMV